MLVILSQLGGKLHLNNVAFSREPDGGPYQWSTGDKLTEVISASWSDPDHKPIPNSSVYFIDGLGRLLDFSQGPIFIGPIPEPETYAMMLAGLGLVGFIARRRKISGAITEQGLI